MENQFSRTELLIGKAGEEKLKKAKVAVFGVGGVGSFVVEGLVRAGVGNIEIVDNDKICLSNLNRQIMATRNTVGRYKVDVVKERIFEINPEANVEAYQEFYMPDSNTNIITNNLSYVADCVDTVTAKIAIVMKCKENNVPVISAMGTGNKLDPSKFEITDIYKTSVCPLAKVMRKELRKRNVESLKVIYSRENPITPRHDEDCTPETNGLVRKQVPGSISFVPSVAGLTIAGEIIREIIKES